MIYSTYIVLYVALYKHIASQDPANQIQHNKELEKMINTDNDRLKGVCHEIIDLYLLHYYKPPGPLTNLGKNILEFGFDFAEIFEF